LEPSFSDWFFLAVLWLSKLTVTGIAGRYSKPVGIHTWGKSPAQDRVWARVAGMIPGLAVRQLIMALDYQVFIDDSHSREEFVLAGHIATVETWAQFAQDWEELLPMGTRTKTGKYHFKMTEMAQSPGGRARSVSFRMNCDDFRRAHDRFERLAIQFGWSIDFGAWKQPFVFAYHALVDNFYRRRQEFQNKIPLDSRVDFIFDKQSEEKLLAPWPVHIAARPEEEQKYYGEKPRFEDDQEFLALQAADLWAWWVREWYEEDANHIPDKMRDFDFGAWRGKPRAILAMEANEDQMLDMIQQISFEHLRDARRDNQFIFPEGPF
jgi:hypothetical protein